MIIALALTAAVGTGPLPATAAGDGAHDYPFYAASEDLKANQNF